MSRQLLKCSKSIFSKTTTLLSTRSLRFKPNQDPEAINEAMKINKQLLRHYVNIFNPENAENEIHPTLDPTIYPVPLENDLGPHGVMLDREHAVLYGHECPSSTGKNDDDANLQNKVGVYSNFENPFLRILLYRCIGFDIENILIGKIKPRDNSSKIRLMTTRQIQQTHLKSIKEARNKLIAPPDFYPRMQVDLTIQKDEQISNFDNCPYIFVDTSERKLTIDKALLNISDVHRDRHIAVREIDGTYRLASWEERERTIPVFYEAAQHEFKQVTRVYPVPPFLKTDNEAFHLSLAAAMNDHQRYIDLLEQGLIQFDLDSNSWADLKNHIFKHMVEHGNVKNLYSNRFYVNFIHWLSEDSLNDLTSDEYLLAISQVLIGQNHRDSTVASSDEVLTMVSTLILLNPKRFSSELSKIIDQTILDDLKKSVIHNFNQRVESICENDSILLDSDKTRPGSKNDLAIDYAVYSENFDKLALIDFENQGTKEKIGEFIGQLREFLLKNRILDISAEALEQFGQ